MEVSIIITCYNYERYVEKAILSAINQNFKEEFEVIIVNDGSFDNSQSIIDKYEDFATIYHIENRGLEKAANYGITKSKGRFFTRLDSDDCLSPNYLKNIIIPVNQNSEISFVYSDYYEIHSHNIRIKKLPNFNATEILKRGDFLATGTLFRKDAFSEAGGYNEKEVNCGLENYELILKMIFQYGMVGFHIDVPLFYYRIHESNMSQLRKERIRWYREKIFTRLGLTDYSTNDYNPSNEK